MKIAKLFRGEKGSVTVIMAAAMVVLAGMMALVTDAGLLYLNQTKMTNALDSAVLAGVQELPEHSELAIEIAYDYAAQNGLDPSEVTFDLNLDDYVLTGQATRNVNLFFARVLGFNDTDVSAQSKARITSLSEVEGIVPFGVLAQTYTYGDKITLKSGPADNLFPGWFHGLVLGETGGANVYRENIAQGYNGAIKIGQFLTFENGNMPQPTKQGLDKRFDNDCSKIIIVPLLEVVKVEGTTPAGGEVLGFGAFSVDSYGDGSEVIGSFIRYVVPGKADSSLNTDYGVYSAQLCR